MSSKVHLQFMLNQNTSGWYICRADNGIGAGIEKKIRIQINGGFGNQLFERLYGKMNVALSIAKLKLCF